MTQQQSILNHILEHGSITAIECTNDLHIMQYNARIHELRGKGIPVERTMETNDETGARYGRYFLEPEWLKKKAGETIVV